MSPEEKLFREATPPTELPGAKCRIRQHDPKSGCDTSLPCLAHGCTDAECNCPGHEVVPTVQAQPQDEQSAWVEIAGVKHSVSQAVGYEVLALRVEIERLQQACESGCTCHGIVGHSPACSDRMRSFQAKGNVTDEAVDLCFDAYQKAMNDAHAKTPHVWVSLKVGVRAALEAFRGIQ